MSILCSFKTVMLWGPVAVVMSLESSPSTVDTYDLHFLWGLSIYNEGSVFIRNMPIYGNIIMRVNLPFI
jgi:hypothetical protein